MHIRNVSIRIRSNNDGQVVSGLERVKTLQKERKIEYDETMTMAEVKLYGTRGERERGRWYPRISRTSSPPRLSKQTSQSRSRARMVCPSTTSRLWQRPLGTLNSLAHRSFVMDKEAQTESCHDHFIEKQPLALFQ